MTTLAPTSLAALEALEYPASPRDIPADITLAELETIRAGWLAQARAQQIPDKLFEIAYWLGGPKCEQPLPKPPKPARVVKFDPEQMDAVITFLRAHERPLPRIYARGGKLVKS